MKVREIQPVYAKKGAFFKSELDQMAEGKNIDETAKQHMKHKPYKCDFGGGKKNG